MMAFYIDIYSYIDFGPFDGFDIYDEPDEGLDLEMMSQIKASKSLNVCKTTRREREKASSGQTRAPHAIDLFFFYRYEMHGVYLP